MFFGLSTWAKISWATYTCKLIVTSTEYWGRSSPIAKSIINVWSIIPKFRANVFCSILYSYNADTLSPASNVLTICLMQRHCKASTYSLYFILVQMLTECQQAWVANSMRIAYLLAKNLLIGFHLFVEFESTNISHTIDIVPVLSRIIQSKSSIHCTRRTLLYFVDTLSISGIGLLPL